MKFQAFHVNPGKKLKKKDVNNDLSNFMSVFPTRYDRTMAKYEDKKPFYSCLLKNLFCLILGTYLSPSITNKYACTCQDVYLLQ